MLYRSFNNEAKKNLIRNLAGDLSQVTDDKTRYIMLSYFYQADKDFGMRMTKAVKANLNKVINLSR